MLFKRHNRSFKFYLLGLDRLEYDEIRRLITENGGEICTTRNAPVITFSTSDSSPDDKPVFHINYIRECCKHGKLLDLVHFRLGYREFTGCLMSIFVRGTSLCPSIDDIDRCCSSMAIEQRDEALSDIIHEHNYAQGEGAMETETHICSDIPTGAPNFSSQDHRFLPDDSSERLLDYSPRDSEFLPDESSQGPLTISVSSAHDSDFLPDISLSGLEVEVEAETNSSPVDSEFLPDESPLTLNVRKDFELLLDDSISSPIGTIVLESPEPSPNKLQDYSNTNIPEPPTVEKLVISTGYDMVEDAFPRERLPASSIDTIVIPGSANAHSPVSSSKNRGHPRSILEKSHSLATLVLSDTNEQRTLPGVNAEGTCSPNCVRDKTNLGKANVEEEDDMQMEPIMGQIKSSQSVTPECAVVFPVVRLKNVAETTSTAVVRREGSISPTILRDDNNQIKILGKSTSEILLDVENFRLSSSDSDVTNYTPSLVVREEDSRLENPSLSVRIENVNNRRRTLRKNSELAGPSKEMDTSEDESLDNKTSAEEEKRKSALRKKRAEERSRKYKSRKGALAKGSGMEEEKSRNFPSQSEEKRFEDAHKSEISRDCGETEVRSERRRTVNRKVRRAGIETNGSSGSNTKRHTMVDLTKSFDDVVSISSEDSDSTLEFVTATSSHDKSASDENPLRKPEKMSTEMQTRNVTTKEKKRLRPTADDQTV